MTVAELSWISVVFFRFQHHWRTVNDIQGSQARWRLRRSADPESWWRILKHRWLYLNTLDSVATVRKLVAFYVEQHNRHLPHSAFHGQTPEEMYFGTGADIPKELATIRELRAAASSRQ